MESCAKDINPRLLYRGICYDFKIFLTRVFPMTNDSFPVSYPASYDSTFADLQDPGHQRLQVSQFVPAGSSNFYPDGAIGTRHHHPFFS